MLLPSLELTSEIEGAEIDFMTDRMQAIQSRLGNPEGIEMQRFGNAIGYYSKTMPWPAFNTVKGLTSADIDQVEPILDFYKQRERKVQLEIIPSRVDPNFLKHLTDRGLYPSGFHSSLIIEPKKISEPHDSIQIRELQEDEFEAYATIHCRGTGLPDDGIPHVANNNKVLYRRQGWKFLIAYVNDVPASVAVMFSKNQRTSLTFAATLPEYRNRGLHGILLKRRISIASEESCKIVVAQCSFLSPSHRNMERVGMKLGYVRTSWTGK